MSLEIEAQIHMLEIAISQNVTKVQMARKQYQKDEIGLDALKHTETQATQQSYMHQMKLRQLREELTNPTPKPESWGDFA